MKTYARIERGFVVELLTTDGEITAMFHPDLQWVGASDVAGIAYGWSYDGERFGSPGPVAPDTAPVVPIIPQP